MFEDHIYKVDRKRNSLSIVDLLRVSFASLVFPRASRQSAPARQQNGKTYCWQVNEKIKDNIKTMPKTLARASCRGADMGGALRKYVEEKGMQHCARDIVYNLL